MAHKQGAASTKNGRGANSQPPAAERLELLPVDRGDTVATATGGDGQRHPVDERQKGHGCSWEAAEMDEGRLP
jgi:ribosomal protein L27